MPSSLGQPLLRHASIPLLLSLAAGCGKRDASTKPADDSIATTSAATEKAEGGFTASGLEDTQCTE